MLESIRQVRGEAANQVADVEIALCHGWGGYWSACSTLVFGASPVEKERVLSKAPTGRLASDQCRHYDDINDAMHCCIDISEACAAARTRTEEDQGDGNQGSLIAH